MGGSSVGTVMFELRDDWLWATNIVILGKADMLHAHGKDIVHGRLMELHQ